MLLGDALHQRRDVLVVDRDRAVDLLGFVELGEPVGDRLCVRVGGPLGEAHPRLIELVAPELERRAAFAADDQPAHLLALASEAALDREGPAEDLPVEGAGQAAVAGQRDDRHRLRLALLEQLQTAQRCGRAGGAGRQLLHPVGVVAHPHDPLLRPAQARGGDELHRLGDLARVPDRPDPPLDVLQGGH